MEKTSFNFLRLKNTVLYVLSMLMIILTSCTNNDDASTQDELISEEEAAEVIMKAITPDTGGLIDETTEAIRIAESNPDEFNKNSSLSKSSGDFEYECNQEYSTSYARSFESTNSLYSYNVGYNWSWILSCSNEGLPEQFNYTFEGQNQYSSPRLASDDSSSASVKITGLELASNSFVVNQEYVRSGIQESSVQNQNSFTSTTTLITDDLTLFKTNGFIESGTVTASFNGESSNGNMYVFSGEIVFHGNQTATLTMGSGNVYEFTW